MDGILIIDKPPGLTSHDVVDRVRRIAGLRAVGHAGTLDPPATGVLVLLLGKATRLAEYAEAQAKEYETVFRFGVETDTLDASGQVTATHQMAVTPDQVADAAAGFVGAIEQIPPMVSAVKVGGRRLHELARQGIEIERAPRPVTIHRIDVAPTADPLVYAVRVECSSGTYVRTLAADLGTALGGGAHLRALRRTAIGPHTEAVAHPLEGIELLAPAAAVAHLAAVVTTGVELVATGRLPELPLDGDGPWAVLGPDGDLLAVAERVESRIKPSVVLVGR